MGEFPILSVLTFLPLLGVLFLILIRGSEELSARNAKYTALFVSICNAVLAGVLLCNFDAGTADFQFVEEHVWFPAFGLTYKLGVDGISLFFVVLSAWLTPVCVLASWTSIKKNVKDYMIAFLVLETLMIGTFLALDLFLFYIFFEAVLIPMFIIIGVWGGQRRVYSAFKFFLYTLLGSVLMLVAMLFIFFKAGSSDIPTLFEHVFNSDIQKWLWLAFFASFAVKMPMFPVHTWLPDAHVEAPTAGSVILAGVLLKMGGYGFLRFSVPMFPDATQYFMPLIFALSVVAIIYTSLIALVQKDMKKLIAYSSVAHMGYVTLGIFALNLQGVQGAIFQMISHGVVSAALFLCVGVVYDRLHTRDIERYGGLVKNMPHYAVVFMIFMLASVGLPGTSGFVGEFLVLIGTYQVSTWVALFAATGLIVGAPYMLWLYRKTVFGPQDNKDASALKDISWRERVILIPMAAIVIFLGVFPNVILEKTEASAAHLITQYEGKLNAYN
ncbi:MAG: NADH-quinone oxidoreductase subunit M [Micavibrio sp.]|nr:NADH-quinone oxidoreductase subunit M [Micavibrio sp.]HCK33435.1 NADH-quinone oxidoreductase subunit M [Rhodospirillaceae bacterium]|tara:strand:+ start:1641 stop:3134 length:1494 start_codon:yes stop_codon:yes gene_type:complete